MVLCDVICDCLSRDQTQADTDEVTDTDTVTVTEGEGKAEAISPAQLAAVSFSIDSMMHTLLGMHSLTKSLTR